MKCSSDWKIILYFTLHQINIILYYQPLSITEKYMKHGPPFRSHHLTCQMIPVKWPWSTPWFQLKSSQVSLILTMITHATDSIMIMNWHVITLNSFSYLIFHLQLSLHKTQSNQLYSSSFSVRSDSPQT